MTTTTKPIIGKSCKKRD